MEKTNFKNLLCWLLFLPASILVTVIATRLLSYFNDFSMYRMGYSDSSLFSRFYEAISNGVVTGYVFVFIGAFIVPKHKKHIAVLLALIINIYLVKELVLKYSSLDSTTAFYAILFIIITLISSLMAMFGVINPDIEN